MKDIKKSVYATFLAIIILILVGYTYDYYNSQTPIEYVISTIEKFYDSPKGIYHRSWRIIKNNYIDETYNHQDWNRWKERYNTVIETEEDARIAIESMLASLNDPYTRYLPEEEFEEQHRNIDSKLHGIGVHITEVDGNIVIISVIDDTPAKKNGLKKKDKIIKVDSISTKGMSLKDVADIIRGEEGTKVVLKILRDDKIITKRIARKEIKIKTVKHSMMENNIAYIRISTFISADTSNEFHKALEETRNADAIIVDVRGNYGGLLSNAVYITDMFLKSGKIVSIVDRNGQVKSYSADDNEFINNKPVVILVDEGSASASEIFSGAMKDHGKAVLIGEKTYGKGRVQMIAELPNGGGINFTIAKYLTPSGRDIDHKGIEPDYTVEYDENYFSEKDDVQINRAVEYIKNNLDKDKAA